MQNKMTIERYDFQPAITFIHRKNSYATKEKFSTIATWIYCN